VFVINKRDICSYSQCLCASVVKVLFQYKYERGIIFRASLGEFKTQAKACGYKVYNVPLRIQFSKKGWFRANLETSRIEIFVIDIYPFKEKFTIG